MRTPVILMLALCFPIEVVGQDQSNSPPSIQSTVVPTVAGNLILIQEIHVRAPTSEVWAAYTTDEGWSAWASPVVEIDLRPGGTIRTNYDPNAQIGDEGTNTVHILNYVPERVLTLQAELDPRWPEVMKEDAENLMNVIVFESLGADQTRILSYGVGYRDTPEMSELMQFFIPANEGLFEALKAYVEK